MRGGKDNRGVRKPLVLFTPKSILRHPRAVSTLDELAGGRFQEILDDPEVQDRAAVTRLLLCSGKVYYDLLAAREQKKAAHVALLRVEQLYPFRESLLREVIERYPAGAEVVWVQEEPKNCGAWAHVKGPIRRLLDASGRKLRYVGRLRSASPSAGSLKRHQREQTQLVEDAFASPIPRRTRTRLVRKQKA
jgi:2-oxoglutarate dehydrogenase E1 component